MKVLGSTAAVVVLGLLIAGSAAADAPLRPYGELVVGAWEAHVEPIDDAVDAALLGGTDAAFAAMRAEGAGAAGQLDGAQDQAQAALEAARALTDPLPGRVEVLNLIVEYQFDATTDSLAEDARGFLRQAQDAGDATLAAAGTAGRAGQAETQRAFAAAEGLAEDSLLPLAPLAEETLAPLVEVVDGLPTPPPIQVRV